MSRLKDLHVSDEKIKKDIAAMANRRGVSIKEMVRILVDAWKKQNTPINKER